MSAIEIKSWVDGEVLYSHECENNSVKLTLEGGVAARAILRGANLRGAYMQDADMQGANMRGADMQGANLQGAHLDSEKRALGLLGRATRSDDHEFFIFSLIGGGTIIKAGCRLLTPDEYRAHVAREYPDTPKSRETLRIIGYLESCATAQDKENERE